MITALAPQPRTVPALKPAVQAVASRQGSGLAFGLFVFLNFILFVRPSEIVQPLLGLELYLFVMIFCLVAAFPVLWPQLWPGNLRGFTGCMIGLTVAVFLSLAVQLRIDVALDRGFDFFKMLLYFLLLQGLVSDKARLRSFLWWLTLFISCSALVSVLDFQGMITLPTASKLKDGTFMRLRGTGIFADPNDLCVLLCLGLFLAAYFLSDRQAGPARLLWLAPMALMFYCLLQTQSRGGLLALMVGVVAVLRARWGWMGAALLGLVALPVLLAFAGDRQASISTSEGTGKARIELWSDGLMMFRSSPVFGIGRDEFAKDGLVAHNTYLHVFAELGLIGGILFVGGFLLALRSLERLSPNCNPILDPTLKHMHPYLFGGVASYMAGMFSLSLTYVLPTFTVLGLAEIFLRLAPVRTPLSSGRFDMRFLARLVLSALAFVFSNAVFVRLMR